MIDPPTFSPDADGVDDFTNVVFKDGMPGYVATVIIYDINGRPIKPLAKTQLIGTNDVLQWDGTYSTGQKAPGGQFGLDRHIGKGTVTVVAVENGRSIAGDEEIRISVVVSVPLSVILECYGRLASPMENCTSGQCAVEIFGKKLQMQPVSGMRKLVVCM